MAVMTSSGAKSLYLQVIAGVLLGSPNCPTPPTSGVLV